MSYLKYTKCELLEELKRYLNNAWKGGCKVVSLERQEMLELMRLDGLGGETELPDVLDQVAAACSCRHQMSPGGHREHVAFICAPSGVFA
jgi:hypothetical protein